MMPFNTENNFDLICGAFSKTKVPHTKLKVFYMNIFTVFFPIRKIRLFKCHINTLFHDILTMKF